MNQEAIHVVLQKTSIMNCFLLIGSLPLFGGLALDLFVELEACKQQLPLMLNILSLANDDFLRRVLLRLY